MGAANSKLGQRGRVSGIAVDSYGGPTIDPTKNVLDLVGSAISRIDDLRESETRRLDDRIAGVVVKIDTLEKHLSEILELRRDHFNQLAAKEYERLNSIRQVDITNQGAAANAALAAIQALASTTTSNADNIRNALTTTATQMAKQTTDLAAAIATQSAATADAMTVRIAALEKGAAEGSGKAGVQDPMMSQLLLRMDSLLQSRAEGSGKSTGSGATISYIISGISALIAIGSFIVLIIKFAG